MGGALYSDGEGCMCMSGESGCASEVTDVCVDDNVSQSSKMSCMSSGRGDVVRGEGCMCMSGESGCASEVTDVCVWMTMSPSLPKCHVCPLEEVMLYVV